MARTIPYALCVSSLGEYRREAITLLREELGDDLEIYASSVAIDPTVRTMKAPEAGIIEAPLRTIKGITFQKLPIRVRVRPKVLVMDLNPRMPQIWLTVAFRRVLGRSTILWGHAWPRKGRSSATTGIRSALIALSSGVITYTHTQAKELTAAFPKKRVFAAPNAIDPASSFAFHSGADRTQFLYVGRLVREKNVELLVRAFATADLPSKICLTLIGEGPDRERLEALAENFGIQDRISFKGHVSSRQALAREYEGALASVSPGYVGLSIIQSLSFGVPMILPTGEQHSPEIEAATDRNSILFTGGNAKELASALRLAYREADTWESRGVQIARESSALYSAEVMAAGLRTSFTETST